MNIKVLQKSVDVTQQQDVSSTAPEAYRQVCEQASIDSTQLVPTAVELNSTDYQEMKNKIEAALMAAAEPLNLHVLANLFVEPERPTLEVLKTIINELMNDYSPRGIHLKEVASGFRFQTRPEYAAWVARLWEEKPPRYSKAFLETLAIIAYRQPITRSEIEDIRGVTVNSIVIRTLIERGWVKEIGHRDVPGKPALLATTKEFLDYFNLKSLTQLPTLTELQDITSLEHQLNNRLQLKLPIPEPEKEYAQSNSEFYPESAIAKLTAEASIPSINQEVVEET